MSAKSNQFQSKQYHAAIGVIERLRANGHTAYLAGGCVRDLLLGVEPNDFDVATDAKPTEIEGYFRKTASVGAAFGVMLVHDFGETIEVATFRSDGSYSDARRPDSVEFSTPKEDAQRRDFTINALFYDPFAEDEDQQIIDFVDGRADVKAMVLRAVGNPADRLKEDHLRALRAVRFAARYGLEIDQTTSDAIREDASELSGVSVERIGEEVRRMMSHPSRVLAVELLRQHGLDQTIFGTPGYNDQLRTLGALDPKADAMTAIAAWRHDHEGQWKLEKLNSSGSSRGWEWSLDLSRAQSEHFRHVLEFAQAFIEDWDTMAVAARKRLGARKHAGEALLLAEAIKPIGWESPRENLTQLAQEPGGLSPKPLVTGADLIELGIKPSPVFKVILDAVYDEQLEGRVQTQPQAIEFVKNKVN